MSCSWNAERVAVLADLWRTGQSAAQIAKRLGGVSRNAVIGKIHRLGLAQRMDPSPPRRARVAPPQPRPARRSPAKPPPPPSSPPLAAALRPARAAPVQVEAVARLFDVAGLSARVCRWPVGDPRLAGFGYCGAAAAGPGPYCQDHHKAAYRGRPAAGAGAAGDRRRRA
jgi:GcrA cell cycle regulator